MTHWLNTFILFTHIFLALMWLGFISFYIGFLMAYWKELERWQRVMFFVAIGFCSWGFFSL